MKKLKIFIQKQCPYCRAALQYLAKLQEAPRYQAIEVELVDELQEKEYANSYDYFYVPSFYYQETKIHEGAIDNQQLVALLELVIADGE